MFFQNSFLGMQPLVLGCSSVVAMHPPYLKGHLQFIPGIQGILNISHPHSQVNYYSVVYSSIRDTNNAKNLKAHCVSSCFLKQFASAFGAGRATGMLCGGGR